MSHKATAPAATIKSAVPASRAGSGGPGRSEFVAAGDARIVGVGDGLGTRLGVAEGVDGAEPSTVNWAQAFAAYVPPAHCEPVSAQTGYAPGCVMSDGVVGQLTGSMSRP